MIAVHVLATHPRTVSMAVLVTGHVTVVLITSEAANTSEAKHAH